jgi:glyoxylase-like metal-dependent hydrolase (beta-lactamase superfamily II)
VGHGASTVVDPQAQDLERYLEFAALKQTKITQVIDTHIQADHESGGRALAARTGAAYGLHESADVAFPFTPLADGQELVCGNVITRVLHTPGHTPESLSLIVTDRTRGPEPWFVLTGDTLFVGTVGRPDLPGALEQSARELYRSVQRLLALPDHTEIYPTHFSGSACGKGMSGKPMSTVAFEKRFNPALALASEDAFVAAITAELPPKPAGMEAMLRQNQGRA